MKRKEKKKKERKGKKAGKCFDADKLTFQMLWDDSSSEEAVACFKTIIKIMIVAHKISCVSY